MKFFLSILAVAMMLGAFGQKPTLELTFTAIDSASYVQLDSIKVMNRTQGGDTVLYYPDTVLVLDYTVGISEINDKGENLRVFQNYPNPVLDQTTITMFVPAKGKVGVVVSDILGRKFITTERILKRGYHAFQATLQYMGIQPAGPDLKTAKNIQSFPFSLGDELLYIGYTYTLQSGMLDTPESSETYIFLFATNIPCPGTPTVTYEGQVYNTIQIYSQCWLKENLNVGMMIQGSQEMTDNDTIEKYCNDNEPDSCTKYGGLYQWNEMMQYITQQGIQGICPPGWHLPTDEEWKVLEGAADSQYGIGDPEWDVLIGYRGYDAGTNLKTTNDWNNNGNGTDQYGFSGLPGGVRYFDGCFSIIGWNGYWWTSTELDFFFSWRRGFSCNYPGVNQIDNEKLDGFSVRCIKDD